MDSARDDRIRFAAHLFVEGLMEAGDGRTSWHDLKEFTFEGQRIPLVGQTGILKPKGFDAALTILTTFSHNPSQRPYYDDIGADNYQRYKWRGDDPNHSDNRALRAAMEQAKPLIWLFGIASGWYVPVMPVLLIAEEPQHQQFVLAFDGLMREQWEMALDTFMTPEDTALQREYAMVTTRQRVHQPVFRQRVITAYRSQCAVCRLRHVELLEAAHIREDSRGGEPRVSNGVAMCVLHHKAFDKGVIGIRPKDLVVETRASVLQEIDGPTLQHALQGVHGQRIVLPRQRSSHPDAELLEERYARFREAS